MNTSKNLNDIVFSKKWGSVFPWGNTIPGSISTLSEDLIDYNGKELKLHVEKKENIGFYYQETERLEFTNLYKSGSFITTESFLYGNFNIALQVNSFMGLNLICGFFNDDFSQSIILFKKSIESVFDNIVVHRAIRINKDEIFKSYIRFAWCTQFDLQLNWSANELRGYINGARYEYPFSPSEPLKFGIFITVNDIAVSNFNNPVILKSFNYSL